MRALSPREAKVFAALADTYCGPEPVFPDVQATDAVAFIDSLAADSRRVNRVAFKVLLRILDVAPFARGYGARFTNLASERRSDFVRSLDRSRWLLLNVASRMLKTLALMSYYGDIRVLRAAGYDPEANVARGRALRRREGRP